MDLSSLSSQYQNSLLNLSNQIIPNIKNPVVRLAEDNYASEFSKIILNEIQEFDNNLSEEFEVGLKLVSFGQTIMFAVHSIGFKNPSLILFEGVYDNSPIKLIQHVSQISFLLTSLPRVNKEIPKTRIGFID